MTRSAAASHRQTSTARSGERPGERLRRCVLTGERRPPEALLRLVLGPDGQVWPDLAGKLPGRGAWIVPDGDRIAAALAKGKLKAALARAFKAVPEGVDPALLERLRRAAADRALQRLGLETRAGFLMFGSDRILDGIRAGRVYALLHAADAAPDGQAKLRSALAQLDAGAYSQPLPAARADLSLALGRENVVHAAITDPAAAQRIARDVARWCGLTGVAAAPNLLTDGLVNE